MKNNWEISDSHNIYFWGGIFSNWASYGFVDPATKVCFNCVEQWMMYQKAITFNDIASADLIMKTNNPKEQKAFGRKVNGYNDDVWLKIARNLIYIGIIEKFNQNKEIRDILLNETDELGIVEASPFDRRWGVGFSVLDAAENKDKWGTNWLGQCIMRARDELRTDSIASWEYYENWKY